MTSGDAGFDGGLLDDSQLDDSLLFSKEPTDFATLAMMAMKENKERKTSDEEGKKKGNEEKLSQLEDEGMEKDEAKMGGEESGSSFAVGAATAGAVDDVDDYAGGCLFHYGIHYENTGILSLNSHNHVDVTITIIITTTTTTTTTINNSILF